MKKLKEYEELMYVKTVFDHSCYTADIIFGKHKTIIFICNSTREAEHKFRYSAGVYKETGVFCLREREIRTDKYTLIFKSRSQVLEGSLRGYDKHTTILINHGGLY